MIKSILIVCLLLQLSVTAVTASSHSETPQIGKTPRIDGTDFYMFRSPDNADTVTFIACYIPLEEPNAGPNFYTFDENAEYEINIDNDQDAVEDITFAFRFEVRIKNRNTFLSFLPSITSLNSDAYNLETTYDVIRITGNQRNRIGTDLIMPPPRVGPTTTPNYGNLSNDGIYDLGNGIRVFAGQVDDPFFADLAAIFDALTIRKVPGNQGGGKDGLGGFNVHAIAIQVPISQLTRNNSTPSDPANQAAIIGGWTDSYLPRNAVLGKTGPRFTGRNVQVSRLGSPLVNEVVIALKDKEKWNSSEPKNDGQFLEYVTDPELAGLLNAIYGLNVPPAPRNDLVEVFLTGVTGLTKAAGVVPSEQLRLNVAVPVTGNPNRLGVLGGDLQGFPNGRRLTDDVIDISLRAVAGVLVNGFDVAPNNQLGDGVDSNDLNFRESFPFLALPRNPLQHNHHQSENTNQ